MERHCSIDAYWTEGTLATATLRPYLNKNLFIGKSVDKYGAFEIKQASTKKTMVTRIYCPIKYQNIAMYFCRKFNYLQACYKLVQQMTPNTPALSNTLDAIKRNIWFHGEIQEAWFRSIEKKYYKNKPAKGKLPEGNMSDHRCAEIESWMRQEYFIQSHHPAKVHENRKELKMNVNVFNMSN
jgi:hypothetical protein